MKNFFGLFNKKDSRCNCKVPENESITPKGLGTFLVEKGIINEEQLKKAIDYQTKNKEKRIGEILYEIDILGEDDILKQLASYLKVEYIYLANITFPLKLQQMFSKKVMLEKKFAPFELSGNIISIAISDINNQKLKDEIENKLENSSVNYHIAYYLAFPGMIKDFILNSYDKHPHNREDLLGQKKKFGEYLLEKNIISQEQLDSVLECQKEFVHKRFGELLYEMKILNREDALKELALHEGKDYEQLQDRKPKKELISLFSLDFMAQNNFVPFEQEDKTIKIAINNIFDDDLIQRIEEELKSKELTANFYISMRDSIRHFIDKAKQ